MPTAEIPPESVNEGKGGQNHVRSMSETMLQSSQLEMPGTLQTSPGIQSGRTGHQAIWARAVIQRNSSFVRYIKWEKTMKAKFHFLDPIITIGIIVSIAMAIILVLVGQDSVISILIGLVITTITLIIDVIARLKESEKNILQSSVLGISLANDPGLLFSLQQIVKDYLAVKNHRYKVFSLGATHALEECHNVMHGLVEGHMTVSPLSYFSFGRSGIDQTIDTMKTVQYANPSYWRTKYGEKYFQSNLEAIKRGVKITRIWLQNQGSLDNYRDVIEAQEAAGIRVLVALLDEVPLELHGDYLIADDEMLVKLDLSLDGNSKAESIYIDPIEVQRAINSFDLLLRYVYAPREFFAEKDQNKK